MDTFLGSNTGGVKICIRQLGLSTLLHSRRNPSSRASTWITSRVLGPQCRAQVPENTGDLKKQFRRNKNLMRFLFIFCHSTVSPVHIIALEKKSFKERDTQHKLKDSRAPISAAYAQSGPGIEKNENNKNLIRFLFSMGYLKLGIPNKKI